MSRSIINVFLSILLPSICTLPVIGQSTGLEQSNITRSTYARDLRDAMPTGNGDIGISMWVQRTGELLFYISKTDAYDDNNRLLKLGLVRINITPNPFVPGSAFQQRLKLKESEITVEAGGNNHRFKMRLWVDANQPVIQIEMSGSQQFTANVKLEDWRRKEYVVKDLAHSDVYNAGVDGSNSGKTTTQYRDSILQNQHNAITWYHHNQYSCWPFTLNLQGLHEFSKTHTDPLLNNIFGAMIYGKGLIQQNDTTLQSVRPAGAQNISIVVQTKYATTPHEWLNSIKGQRTSVENIDINRRRTMHEAWWNQFWNRSYINIHTEKDTGALITRSYVLQRYMVACSGRGKGWVKFNGSIFTLPDKNKFDADYRRWGSAQWFQNARLLYWPLVYAGDFDMLAPFYGTFLNALPLVKERTRLYYGHDGAFFSETAYAWGTYANPDYGYNHDGAADGLIPSTYIRRHWSGGLELSAMMLQQYQMTRNNQFLTDTLLRIASEVIRFYDQHWKRGVNGKIYFNPSQSLETWQTAINPLPEIAGLQYVLSQLLYLPEDVTTSQQRAEWKRTLTDLPPLPMKTIDGKSFLLPADSVTQPSNVENPELYAVFPFRLFGVGKPSLETAKNSYAVRVNKESRCWYQDDAQAAYLGLADEAAKGVAKRMTDCNPDYGFPSMWGPGNDELPDMDHGGVGQLAMQAMLMQSDKNKIVLFPAWPKRWDVSFKLLAPEHTVIEGQLKNGKLQKLVVTPASRSSDITIMPLQ